MKKIVLAAVMLLSSVSMFAQHEVGSLTIQPKVGFNVSNVTKTLVTQELVWQLVQKLNIN